MRKLWFVSALMATLTALALFAGIALAEGVTVFTGSVTLNGTAAPAGTVVNVTTSTGIVIGTGITCPSPCGGSGGFAANQYRIDIQATPALEGQTVNLIVPGTSQATPASAVFNANFPRFVNIVATTTGGVVPVATALTASFNTTAQLNSIFGLDAAGNPTLVYDPARPASFNTLTTLNRGVGYFVKTNVTTTTTIESVSYTFTGGVLQLIGFIP